MLETLIELGIFVSEKEVLSQKEIFEKGSITETQKNTVARWLEILKTVSYTHLDVYKRQLENSLIGGRKNMEKELRSRTVKTRSVIWN